MKIIKVLSFTLVFALAHAGVVCAEIPHVGERYFYWHLAMGANKLYRTMNKDEQAKYDNVEFPVYIGYLKISGPMQSHEIRDIEFVRVTELPVSRIESSVRAINNQKYATGRDDEDTSFSDEWFLYALNSELWDLDVRHVFTEEYSSDMEGDFSKPAVSAEDFIFTETYVFHADSEMSMNSVNINLEVTSRDAMARKYYDRIYAQDMNGILKIIDAYHDPLKEKMIVAPIK